MKYGCLILSLICSSPVLAAEQPAASQDSKKPEAVEHNFVTSSGHKVTLIPEWFPEFLDMDSPRKRPMISPPVEFNSRFTEAAMIWMAPGGYFASFDAGEWGGSFFYAPDGAKSWSRVIDSHVQNLGQFSESAFLAVGGLSHMMSSQGKVQLITRTPAGKWKTKTLMDSGWGVPVLIGESTTPLEFNEPQTARLLVVSIPNPMEEGPEPVIGFDISGKSYFLGLKSRGESGPRD